MPLVTKNNKILVLSGNLQTDCNCCGEWYCHIGGCCNDGTCTNTTECDCEEAGGTYLGDGVLCASKNGACCDTTSGTPSCSVVPECECVGTGKSFQGVGTTCATSGNSVCGECQCPSSSTLRPQTVTVSISNITNDNKGVLIPEFVGSFPAEFNNFDAQTGLIYYAGGFNVENFIAINARQVTGTAGTIEVILDCSTGNLVRLSATFLKCTNTNLLFLNRNNLFFEGPPSPSAVYNYCNGTGGVPVNYFAGGNLEGFGGANSLGGFNLTFTVQ